MLDDVRLLKLADLEDFEGETCVIIGTLYKHQQWKPSILQELSEEHQLSLPASRSDYCSEKDQVFLEDEMLRIKLVGKLVDLESIVTGVVCAVLGSEEKDGTFQVSSNAYKSNIILHYYTEFFHIIFYLGKRLVFPWLCA